jgi:hypothetical protein
MAHYGTHLREAFCDWLDEGCPPLARVEVNYEPQTWEADRLLRRMLNCSDIMPGDFYREIVETHDLHNSRKQTYGSVARLLLVRMNEQAAARHEVVGGRGGRRLLSRPPRLPLARSALRPRLLLSDGEERLEPAGAASLPPSSTPSAAWAAGIEPA